MLLFEVLLKQKESNRVVVFQFNLEFSLYFSQSLKQSWVICFSFCFDAIVGQVRISFRASIAGFPNRGSSRFATTLNILSCLRAISGP